MMNISTACETVTMLIQSTNKNKRKAESIQPIITVEMSDELMNGSSSALTDEEDDIRAVTSATINHLEEEHLQQPLNSNSTATRKRRTIHPTTSVLTTTSSATIPWSSSYCCSPLPSAASIYPSSYLSPSMEDEDVEMKNQDDLPSHMTHFARSSSSYGDYTPFTLGPCMVKILEFTSIHDRIRALTTAKSWLTSIQLPSLWVTCGVEIKESDPEVRLPEWLRSRVTRLSVEGARNKINSLSLQLFSRIQHLELDGFHRDGPSIDNWTPADIDIFRAALQSLRLTSIKMNTIGLKLIHCMFGRSTTMDLSDSEAVDTVARVQFDESDVRTHPAIWSWSTTLTKMDIYIHLPEAPSLSFFVNSLSHREWTELVSLNLRGDESDLKSNKPNLQSVITVKELFTARRFPVLRDLTFEWKLNRKNTELTSNETILYDHIFQCIQRELVDLQRFDCKIVVQETETSSFTYPIRVFPSSITELLLHTPTESLPSVIPLSQLKELCLNFEVDISIYQLFFAIGHHHLPHLSDLDIEGPFEGEEIKDNQQRHQQVIQFMTEMVALTSLRVERPNHDGAPPEPPTSPSRFYWTNHVHCFPNLKDLVVWIRLSEGMSDSIAKSLKLENLNVWAITNEQLDHLLYGWSLQQPKAMGMEDLSLNSPLAVNHASSAFNHSHGHINIQSLVLNYQPTDEPASLDSIPRVSCILQLSCLSHLTDLMIINLGDDNWNAMVALSELRALKRLRLENQVPSLNKHVLEYWTRPGNFPQLTTLRFWDIYDLLTDSDQDSTGTLSSIEALDYLVRIPHLHTIQFYPIELTSIPLIEAQLQQVNGLGRSPPLEFKSGRARVGRMNMSLKLDSDYWEGD